MLYDVWVDWRKRSSQLDIWAATSVGADDCVRNLLTKNPKLVNAPQPYDKERGSKIGALPLSLAASHGCTKVVQLLIDRSANVNQFEKVEGQKYSTALMWAALNGYPDIVKILLEADASLDLQNDKGQAAIHLASLQGHDKVVKRLLKDGAEVDKQNGKGNTALHAASLKGHDKVVEILLQNNAKVDEQDKRGQTALHWHH